MLTYVTLEVILRGRVQRLLVEKAPMRAFGSRFGHALRVCAAIAGLGSFVFFVRGSLTATGALVLLAK